MALGPGKYDDVCTRAMLETDAIASVLIVIEGNRGTGFSVNFRVPDPDDAPALLAEIASAIRSMTNQMEADAAKLSGNDA